MGVERILIIYILLETGDGMKAQVRKLENLKKKIITRILRHLMWNVLACLRTKVNIYQYLYGDY